MFNFQTDFPRLHHTMSISYRGESAWQEYFKQACEHNIQ